jgi:hypothetical protein
MNLTSQIGKLKIWKQDKSKEEEQKKAKDNKPEEKKFLSSSKYRKKRYKASPKSMKTEPRDGQTTKTVKNIEYHWCTHHKLWQCTNQKNNNLTQHIATKSDQHQNVHNRQNQKTKKEQEPTTKTINRQVQFSPVAHMAVVNHNNDF